MQVNRFALAGVAVLAVAAAGLAYHERETPGERLIRETGYVGAKNYKDMPETSFSSEYRGPPQDKCTNPIISGPVTPENKLPPAANAESYNNFTRTEMRHRDGYQFYDDSRAFNIKILRRIYGIGNDITVMPRFNQDELPQKINAIISYMGSEPRYAYSFNENGCNTQLALFYTSSSVDDSNSGVSLDTVYRANVCGRRFIIFEFSAGSDKSKIGLIAKSGEGICNVYS